MIKINYIKIDSARVSNFMEQEWFFNTKRTINKDYLLLIKKMHIYFVNRFLYLRDITDSESRLGEYE
jgi:hypothetical protein